MCFTRRLIASITIGLMSSSSSYHIFFLNTVSALVSMTIGDVSIFTPWTALFLCVYTLVMVAILQLQVHRLRCHDDDACFLDGLVGMIADLLENHKDPQNVLTALTTTRFRSICFTIFDASTYDVVAESCSPTRSSDVNVRSPASDRQYELMNLVLATENGSSENKKRVRSTTIYRPCSTQSSTPQLGRVSFARTRAHLVVACSCGHEQA